MCLKIWDDDANALSTTAIVKALDYLIGHREIRISNHSYGGFGLVQSNIRKTSLIRVDAVEKYAMETLSRTGHLAFVSAGNNGCDLDCTDDCTRCPS